MLPASVQNTVRIYFSKELYVKTKFFIFSLNSFSFINFHFSHEFLLLTWALFLLWKFLIVLSVLLHVNQDLCTVQIGRTYSFNIDAYVHILFDTTPWFSISFFCNFWARPSDGQGSLMAMRLDIAFGWGQYGTPGI